jgi:hypothetical protein
VRGDVVAAQNGDALRTSLAELYRGKVLAESQTEPALPSSAADPAGARSRPAAAQRQSAPSVP